MTKLDWSWWLNIGLDHIPVFMYLTVIVVLYTHVWAWLPITAQERSQCSSTLRSPEHRLDWRVAKINHRPFIYTLSSFMYSSLIYFIYLIFIFFFNVSLSLIYSEVTSCNWRLTHILPSYLASRLNICNFSMCVCVLCMYKVLCCCHDRPSLVWTVNVMLSRFHFQEYFLVHFSDIHDLNLSYCFQLEHLSLVQKSKDISTLSLVSRLECFSVLLLLYLWPGFGQRNWGKSC